MQSAPNLTTARVPPVAVAFRAACLAAIGGAVVCWLLPGTAWANDPSYIFGISDNNDIYQINPVPDQQSFGLVYNTGLAGQSNAFAFDRERDQMFFINPSGTFGGTPYSNGLFFSGTSRPARSRCWRRPAHRMAPAELFRRTRPTKTMPFGFSTRARWTSGK